MAHLINRVIDSNVFGSGHLDTSFRLEPGGINQEMSRWLDSRKLSYYHDEVQGVLYLQFSSVQCPVNEGGPSEFGIGLESVFEDQEFGDLQGLLFMFSVCHILILIQEGSRFDTQILKKFRVLQAAKQSMSPYVRSKNTSPGKSRLRSSAHARLSSSGASPSFPPGKSRGILNRNSSAVTIMPGLGSYTSLLPGQCTPVIHFVFLDDFTEIHPGGTEETSELSQVNMSSSANSSARTGLTPTKGFGSVIVLARPVNKSEGGLRKKLQSSLEAQIRFSIKKCRTLTVDSSHAGSRNGASSASAPLFSLDASRAVSLVDYSSCQSGEALEFAISLVEEVLDGKATPDSLLESHHQNVGKEDILSVKEFIHRQSDLLRGRGSLVGNTSTGTVAGVGMVAAAAAAAAASTSGKTMTALELPSFEIWLSSSQSILRGILSAKQASRFDTEIHRVHEQGAVSQAGVNLATSSNPFESAINHLENSIGLNIQYSTLWCQKAFPIAKEVYLEDLPTCYPSSQHEEHLNKALRTFTSMVKGPAVKHYVKKLIDECTSTWSTGRQLCDAISLTGRPCMHQRHDIRTLPEDEIKPHSSGFVYLHACACGRSRQLRSDPFDYETANVSFCTFADCDKIFPSVKFPERGTKGPVQLSSWNLIRVGGARYYDPSKGLLQSGFCTTQKFLLRWTIFIEKLKEGVLFRMDDPEQISFDKNTKAENVVDEFQTLNPSLLSAGGNQYGVGAQIKPSVDVIGNNWRLPNFAMKKQFSEVVAGPASANSGFPPLSSTKQPSPEAEKGVKIHLEQHLDVAKFGEIIYDEESRKLESVTLVDKVLNESDFTGEAKKYGNSFPRLGSTVVGNVNGGEPSKAINSVKNVTVYMGFEHECPHGHRFILTLDHLNDIGLPYIVSDENVAPFSVENSTKKHEHLKFGKYGGHTRTRRQSNGAIMIASGSRSKNLEKSKEKLANGNMNNKSMQSTRHGKYQNDKMRVQGLLKHPDSDLKSATIDDSSSAFSLLNRSLPIYMNCPHCKDSNTKSDSSNVKFASTVSQLQRIFVVTPPFPVVLAADPVVQFESSCLPPSVPDREQKLRFSLDCPVILPPESFLSLRLPFVYGVELEDGSLHSLKTFENQPHLTACIVKGTAFRVVSNRSNLDPAMIT